ncbi:MAG TPA: VOC family protein [Allosphingosinicella sp.]|jgi:catechol 2,3-dioxygenase-like lactoylglutathione lyase family enzyme
MADNRFDLGQVGTPVAFLNVGERERALRFYRDTLGLELRSSDDFGDFLSFGAALLRMTVLPDYKPNPHPILGWNVEEIRSAVERLRAQGIEFIVYEGMGQDKLGIWTAPDGKAKVAFFADPDGNVLSISQA